MAGKIPEDLGFTGSMGKLDDSGSVAGVVPGQAKYAICDLEYVSDSNGLGYWILRLEIHWYTVGC